MPKEKIKIIGIDPGIERVGIAVIEKDFLNKPKEKIVFSECFKTSKNLGQEERLTLIYERLIEILKKHKPDVAIVEKIFFTVNQKTAIAVAEARGAILTAVGKSKINLLELSPTEIKESITGNGSAKKPDIARMLPKIIELDIKIKQDDELDAIAIALAGSSRLRYSQFR